VARCLLGLGSNLGDRRELLRSTCRAISDLAGVKLLARSQWHETTPIGGPAGQSPFLNGALLVQTTLQPHALAAKLHELETQLGRSRRVRWSARTVDLDVLLVDETTIASSDLIVPHPRMSFRRFVLEPAVEIAPWMRHPTSGWTLAQLLRHLNTAAQYVAVVAADERVSRWLAQQMSETLQCPTWKEPPAGHVVEGLPPAIRSCWRLGDQATRPALILAVDPNNTDRMLKSIGPAQSNWTPTSGSTTEPTFRQLLTKTGHGPMAQITTDDPATLLAEAEAAILAVWPNIAVGNGPEKM